MNTSPENNMNRSGESTPRKALLQRSLALAAASLVAILSIYFLIVRPGNEPADYNEMRRYILGHMTDKQLRELHETAIVEFEKSKAQASEKADEFWKQKRADLEKCKSDIAFRTRNLHACSLPIGFESIGQPYAGRQTVDETFESLLMGICGYELTVRDARKYKCLP